MKPTNTETVIADELPKIQNLECDGATRVLHYALTKAGIKHQTYTGIVKFNGKVIPLHYWIELSDGRIVDYKLRMWLGADAPEGIFKPKGIKYSGVSVNLPVNETLYHILTFASGGEIEPHKEVAASKTVAIKEVAEKYGLKEMEAAILYQLKDVSPILEYDYVEWSGFRNGKYSRKKPIGLKGAIFVKLEEKGFVEYSQYEEYELTSKAKDFIQALEARIETRRAVKAGYDLFPEQAAIPELKAITPSTTPPVTPSPAPASVLQTRLKIISAKLRTDPNNKLLKVRLKVVQQMMAAEPAQKFSVGGEINGLTAEEAFYLWVKRGLKAPYREKYLRPLGLFQTEKSKEVEAKLKSIGALNFGGAITEQGKELAKKIDVATNGKLGRLHMASSYDLVSKFNEVKEVFGETKFASGGAVEAKRNIWVRFNLSNDENFMKWKIENKETGAVTYLEPSEVQIVMYNCKLTNSPATAQKIFTGQMTKAPIAYVRCESAEILYSSTYKIKEEDWLRYNPRKAPNWQDSTGNNIDNTIYPRLITKDRGVYIYHKDNSKEKLKYDFGGELNVPKLNLKKGDVWINKFAKEYPEYLGGSTPTDEKVRNAIFASQQELWQLDGCKIEATIKGENFLGGKTTRVETGNVRVEYLQQELPYFRHKSVMFFAGKKQSKYTPLDIWAGNYLESARIIECGKINRDYDRDRFDRACEEVKSVIVRAEKFEFEGQYEMYNALKESSYNIFQVMNGSNQEDINALRILLDEFSRKREAYQFAKGAHTGEYFEKIKSGKLELDKTISLLESKGVPVPENILSLRPANKEETSESKMGDTWRKDFEKLKATNDLDGIQNLYDKIKIALNGIAQSKGEATVNDFRLLKKEIEDFAATVNENKSQQQNSSPSLSVLQTREKIIKAKLKSEPTNSVLKTRLKLVQKMLEGSSINRQETESTADNWQAVEEAISDNHDKLGEVDRFGNIKGFLTEQQNKDFYKSNQSFDEYVARLYTAGKLTDADAAKVNSILAPNKEDKEWVKRGEAFWNDARKNAKRLSEMSHNEFNDWMVENHFGFYKDNVTTLRYVSPSAEDDAIERLQNQVKGFLKVDVANENGLLGIFNRYAETIRSQIKELPKMDFDDKEANDNWQIEVEKKKRLRSDTAYLKEEILKVIRNEKANQTVFETMWNSEIPPEVIELARSQKENVRESRTQQNFEQNHIVLHIKNQPTPYGVDRVVGSYLKNGFGIEYDRDLARVEGNPNYNTPEKFNNGLDEFIRERNKKAEEIAAENKKWAATGGYEYISTFPKYKQNEEDILAHKYLAEVAETLKKKVEAELTYGRDDYEKAVSDFAETLSAPARSHAKSTLLNSKPFIVREKDEFKSITEKKQRFIIADFVLSNFLAGAIIKPFSASMAMTNALYPTTSILQGNFGGALPKIAFDFFRFLQTHKPEQPNPFIKNPKYNPYEKEETAEYLQMAHVIGNTKEFSANVIELVEKHKPELIAAINKLTPYAEIKDVKVYGSIAEGRARNGSDIDLKVIYTKINDGYTDVDLKDDLYGKLGVPEIEGAFDIGTEEYQEEQPDIEEPETVAPKVLKYAYETDDEVTFYAAGNQLVKAKIKIPSIITDDGIQVWLTSKGYKREDEMLPAIISAAQTSSGGGYKMFKGLGGSKYYEVKFADGDKFTSYRSDRASAIDEAVKHRLYQAKDFPKTKFDKTFTEALIPINKIRETNSDGQKLADAITDVKDGLTSKTEGKILVYKHPDSTFEIADGFHRVAEAILRGDESILADVTSPPEYSDGGGISKYDLDELKKFAENSVFKKSKHNGYEYFNISNGDQIRIRKVSGNENYRVTLHRGTGDGYTHLPQPDKNIFAKGLETAKIEAAKIYYDEIRADVSTEIDIADRQIDFSNVPTSELKQLQEKTEDFSVRAAIKRELDSRKFASGGAIRVKKSGKEIRYENTGAYADVQVLNPSSWYLAMIEATKEGKGYAYALMQKIIADAKAAGAKKITLSASLENQQYFEYNHGFTTTGFDEADWLYSMELDLTKKPFKRGYATGGSITAKLLAPNGKPSNLTPEQYALVRTAEFKAWFGDWEKLALLPQIDSGIDEVSIANLSKGISKVVDGNGEPLVCWHSSNKQFTEFRTIYSEIGAHFGTKTQANDLAISQGKSGKMYQVFLNIKNPIRLTDKGAFNPSVLADKLLELGYISETQNWDIHSLEMNEFFKEAHLEVHQLAQKSAIDGVVYLNTREGINSSDAEQIEVLETDSDFEIDRKNKLNHPEAKDSWIVFLPEQIKLADGSNQTFDSNSADIRYATGGELITNE